MTEPAEAAEPEAVRWAMLGTSRNARTRFLPGLAAAGGGVAYIVGSRDVHVARDWAVANGVQSWEEGYTAALVDPLVTAVYIPLPNALHVEWTIAALQAGRAVLCEKPLCLSIAETERVVEAARETGQLLWEAFVFLFHPQTALVQKLLVSGAIGTVREVEASFHFVLPPGQDVRWDRELGGGALNDLGCYPIRLARLLFGAEPVGGSTHAERGPSGVDAEISGELDFGEGRLLRFSCGFRREGLITRVVGDAGELRISNPYHPKDADTVEVWRDGALAERHPAAPVLPFAAAVRHVQDAIQGRTAPRHLAVDDALGQARAMELVRHAAGLDHGDRL